jgi:hypothetical protein
MTTERHPAANQSPSEKQQDLEWIDQNRDIFWLSSTTAYEEIGRGVLLVDLCHVSQGIGQPFSYYAEGELEIDEEELKRHLDDYDPSREFIVVLQKPTSSSIYRGYRPGIGWMADLSTRTQYGPFSSSQEANDQ